LKTLVLGAICAGWAAASTFTYTDFSSVAGLTLNGDAAQAGNVLRLVHADVSLAGNAFRTSSVALDSETAFNTMFEFHISTDPSDPTDGFSFILQNDPGGASALGGQGQGAGYAGLSPSVAVMFRGRGPSFIGAILNGVDPLPGKPPNAADFNENDFYNQDEFAWITYDPIAKMMNVYLSTTSAHPLSPVMSANVDLAGTIGASSMYVGFGAGTGGAFGDNDVLNWTFSTTQAPEPATIGALGLGLAALLTSLRCPPDRGRRFRSRWRAAIGRSCLWAVVRAGSR
jgi:hypothetical protein